MAIIAADYTKTKHTGIKLHKDGITFLFDIRVDGKRYRKKWESNPRHTPSDKLKTAYAKCEEFHNDTLHQNTIVADMDATVFDYWEKLKVLKTAGKKEEDHDWKPYLIKEYDNYYKRNLSHLSNIKVKDVKPATITNLNVSLAHLAKRSRVKAYEILLPLFKLAIEDEVISTSPIKKNTHVPKRKQIEEKKVIMNAKAKYRLVHEAIMKVYEENHHHRAIFLFGFHGRRIGEVVQLQWQDINLEDNTYLVRGHTSKTNTDMVFDLPLDVREALLHFRDTTGNVFHVKSVDRQYYKIRDYTGIPEFSFHWMRNLAVSALSAMGVESIKLSSMLGHNDGATVTKYLSLQREDDTKATNEASQRLLS